MLRFKSPEVKADIILWVSLSFFIIALIWMYFASIDEITRGEGKVITSSEIKTIQNLEGGIVKKILVQEGATVRKNQILMLIDDTIFASSYNENKLKIVAMQIKKIRLQAEATNKMLIFASRVRQRHQDLVRDEEILYLSRQRELQVKLAILDQELVVKQQELLEAKNKEKQLIVSVALIAQEAKLTRSLVADGAVSKIDLLRLKRNTNDTASELAGVRINIPKLLALLRLTKQRLREAKIIFTNQAQESLNRITLELAGLQETSLALKDRVARTMVRSPVNGKVNQISVNTIGGIIKPGESVMDIVPLDDTLIIEAEIKPSDIGFIRPGFPVIIKLTAYDFAIYGALQGTVTNISPDTVMNDRQMPMYQIKIKTANNFLLKGNKRLPIMTGMRASVDIVTGKKTILDYLLKPIIRGTKQALTER